MISSAQAATASGSGGVGGVGRHRPARHAHHVARQLEIDRARLVDGGGEHAGDLGRRGGGIVEPGLGAGDLLVDAELGVERAALMVQEEARAALRRGRGRRRSRPPATSRRRRRRRR